MNKNINIIAKKLTTRKIKYFRYIDEYHQGNHFHLNDILFCVHIISEIDVDRQTFKAFNTSELDPLVMELPFSFLLTPTVELLNTTKFDELFAKKAEEDRLAMETHRKHLKEEADRKNREKDENFARLNPPLKRGSEVRLIDVPHSWIDFTKPGDTFFIDDVSLIDNVFVYALLVFAPRGKRGVYNFHTDIKFHDYHIKVK